MAITPEQFDLACERTRIPSKAPQMRFIADGGTSLTLLLQAGMGISKEGGEILDAIYRRIYYGKEIDKVNLKEELGDLCWYMSQMIFELDSTWEEIMEMNVEKLKVRYPHKFTEKDALVRNLDDERRALEGK